MRFSTFLPTLAFVVSTAVCRADSVPSGQAPQSIPFEQLGAEAQKQYTGDGIAIIPGENRARLLAAMQDIEGEATREGLWLRSTAEEDTAAPGRFRVQALTVGRGAGDALKVLAPHGTVKATSEVVSFWRSGLVEEYRVSTDGVRQDFVLPQRPGGQGALRVRLGVTGARATPASYGARLTLHGNGREIAYSRLQVTDAGGRALTASMEVPAPDQLVIHVDDAGAMYPLRIDPTFSDADWISTGGYTGAEGYVNAMAVDASGNLYIAGEFIAVSDILANRIAKWNGSTWTPLGEGLNGLVETIAVSGNNVYAGGEFSTAGGVSAARIARWDGTSWSAMGSGMNGKVMSLAVHGTTVIAGGPFTTAGGTSASRLAKWDGSTWSSFGSGVTGSSVNALVVAGTDLYASGYFTAVDGVAASNIAKWDGTSWSALGSGINSYVNALAFSGSTLYAGGSFTQAGGVSATYMARWNGSAWSAMGSGPSSQVQAIAVSGSTVYVGKFIGIQRWTGSSWSNLGSGVDSGVNALVMVGSNLYVGGKFSEAGGLDASYLARWSGTAWSTVGTGLSIGIGAMAISGGDLYIGGTFERLNGLPVYSVARWNGSTWSALGGGLNYLPLAGSLQPGRVTAMLASGGNLYVGGYFQGSGSDPYMFSNLAKWNGTSWSYAGSVNIINYQKINALAMIGSDLYIGGDFTTSGGLTVNGLAKWNGSTMSAVGTGVAGSSANVHALAVSGTDLYVGGSFTSVNGTAASNIAKFSSGTWSTVGTGMNSTVRALHLHGSYLYAGGSFTTAGGKSARGIARWDGTGWNALGSGLSTNGEVLAIAFSGTDLYIGGRFTSVDGVAASNIAKWNGSTWSALGSGVSQVGYWSGEVRKIAPMGTTLFVGGGFVAAGNKVSPSLAKVVNIDAPEVAVSGSSVNIADGSSTPSAANNTDFGGHGVNDGPITRTFVIQNTGTTGLPVGAVTVGGTHAAEFAVTSQPASVVAAGGSTTFEVSFDPAAVGLRSATLAFANDDFDEGAFDFSIQGTGTNNAPTDIALVPGAIAENNVAGASVGLLSATDADAADTHTFTLVAGTGATDNGLFSITGSTLKLNTSANFESKNNYSIRVQANDGKTGLFEKELTVSITNVNEAPTNITLSQASLAENNPVNTVVGSFSSADVDAGDTHTYTLVSGTGSNDNGSFAIDGASLVMLPSANFESKSSYALRIRTTDAGTLAFEKQFTVTITNVNEAPTDIALSASSIAENNAANATVGTLGATDVDAGDTRSYALVSGTGSDDNASFTITGSSLKIIPSANFEAKSSYNVRVRVTDMGGLSFEKPFTIAVTNVNEAPTDTLLSASSIAENNLANATVGSFSATDVDAGDSHGFTLVAGTGSTDNGSFTIVGTALRLTPSANYETKGSYSIRVRATDTGGLSFDKPFVITVTNVNEAPTNISLSASSIAENNTADATVGTLSAADADAGDTRAYSLVAGPGDADNASFSLSGSTLRLSAVADFETKSTYSVLIRVTDGGDLHFDKAFAITITNVNEAPTDIALSATSIAENSAANATVGTLSATDVDAGDTHAYSLVSGSGSTDNALFTISGSALRLTTPADFETKSSHSVRIRATDGGTLSYEKAFTITVQNVNEAPSFVKGTDLAHAIHTSAAQSMSGWATAIDDGDSTVEQSLVFNVAVVSGGALFASPPALSSSGTLTYTPNGTPGTAVLSVSLTDDASINSTPAVTTGAQTFTIRVEGPGSVDPLDAAVSGLHVLAAVTQPDGKIILAGNFTSVLGVPRGNIARLNANGTLDQNFDPRADGSVYAVAVQADGKILLGGSFTTLQPNGAGSATARAHVARLQADGTLDPSFDPKANSHVRSVAVQADGSVLLAGDFTTLQPGEDATATVRQHLARLRADGALDSAFDPKANDVVYSVATQPDGKILVGGDFTTLQANGAPTPTTRRFIARLSAEGAVESGFDPRANGTVYALTVQGDGKVLLGGAFSSLQPNGAPTPTARNCIARLHANGSLDNAFNPNADNAVLGFALQADGKVLLGGAFTSLRPNGAAAATERHAIARLHPDGTLDAGFDPKANGTVHGVALQADGRVLAAGEFTTLQPNEAPVATARSLFARLGNDVATRVLAVPGFTEITWTYDGAAPAMELVTFELSTDGTNWTPLGVGTRPTPPVGWQLAGLSLPASGTIRARGHTLGGIYNGSGGLIEELMPFTVAVPAIALEDEAGSGLGFGTSLDLGPVLVGGSTLVTQFTIRNTGNAGLAISDVSVAGANAADFVVSTAGMATSLPPLASTSFTLTFTPGAKGARSASLRVGSNAPGRNFFDVTLAALGVDEQQQWRRQHFGTVHNSGHAADTADADGDGIPNLLEWACNLSPTSPGTLPAEAVRLGAFMEFRYTRSVVAVNAGTQFKVEWNDSLAPEGWSSAEVTEQVLSDDGKEQVVKASVPTGSGSRRFMRLSVSTN